MTPSILTVSGQVCISSYGDKLSYVLRIHFKAPNNASEYEATLHGLRIAVELDIKWLMVFGDSALVICQVNKDWDCTSKKMDAYYAQIRKLENKFYGLEFHHVVRADNEAVDKLSKLGSTQAEIHHGVFIQDLVKTSIDKEEKPVAEQPSADQLVATVPTTGIDWREPFIRYLTSAKVPHDKTEMEHLIRRSKHYVLVEGKLMRKNVNDELLQKCVS
jgi:ribonuclease HI